METAIRWSPTSSVEEQRFLLVDVTGRSFRHCKVESCDGKGLKYDTISVHRNVPAFRAFDWSSLDENIVAIGEGSGSATVLRLDDEQSSPLSLPVKSQRPANAVAFAKTGLLAVGLERVRNDTSLNFWDVGHCLLASTSPVSNSRKTPLESVRKYASSEAITSIKFFQDQPDTLVAGVKGTCIRLYDLRETTGNPIVQFPTSSVHNIGIDPLDENYFASAGAQKDTTIHIWDRRVGPSSSTASFGSGSGYNAQFGPVLEYRRAFEASTPAAQPQIWSLRYCRGRRGYLGALASNGDFKIFETKQAHIAEVDGLGQGGWSNNGQTTIQQKLRTERVHHVTHAPDSHRHGREDVAHTVAFDFTNLAGPKGRPSALVVRSDKGIEVRELQGHPPPFALSSTGQLVISSMGHGIKKEPSVHDNILAEAGLYQVRPRMDNSSSQAISASERLDGPAKSAGDLHHKQQPTHKWSGRLSSRENHERWFEDRYLYQVPSVEAALATLQVSRRRCVQGYLFDCQRNIEVVADDPWLQDMWEWIGRKSTGLAYNLHLRKDH